LKLLPRKRIDADSNIGKGMDLALMMLVFLGLGYLVDRWLGTHPVFMIALSLLGFAGQITKLCYDYDLKMKAHEAERAATARGGR